MDVINEFEPNTNNTWYSWIFSLSWMSWIFIILFLALLGINIFAYLAKGTEIVSNISKKLLGATAEVTGNIVDTGAEGAKTVVDTTAEVLDTTLTGIQKVTPNTKPKSEENDFLTKANTASSTVTEEPMPNEAEHIGKAGFCYIGTDRGVRTCAKVGVNDTCMSGDIFPSNEICINPTLRP
jgi:hypothetical protein